MSLLLQKSKGCSQCCDGTLEMKESIQAVSLDEAENRDSEACAYYECNICGYRVKEFESGRTEIPDGEEWEQFCE